MKKFLKIAVSLCLIACLIVGSSLLLSACGDKETELAYGTVVRDDAKTGGETLSFIYDSETHTATFGGEGEEILFYEADIDASRTAGNRVGVKITAPSGVTDFSTAKLVAGGKCYENGSFLTGNSFDYVADVSESKKEDEIKIRWQDGSKEQIYKIKIAGGTTFAGENNNEPTDEGTEPSTNNNEPAGIGATFYNRNNTAQNGANTSTATTNGSTNYNGRAYNGYNRNVERIRENYRINRIRPSENENTELNR